MVRAKVIALFCFTAIFFNLNAQQKPDQIYVDDQGVMRWSEDNSELHGFGANYTLPFAHEYRMAVKTGIDLQELIRQDVYHMARLDFDLYRVHVWDTEISDTAGNLLENEHLKLFDFMIHEMIKRGMRFIITPVAYWGNGWPEEDEATPGFSHKYGKAACLTHPEAIKAQANYLSQFIRHVNAFTGVAYKDEPRIIGFEISNEPHHEGTTEIVTDYINTMVTSMRQTGCTKLIFYNMSHSIDLAGGYLDADIQGGTFQWYPTNLVAGHQINGNFLPHVENYNIPFANDPKFKGMAKIVYEFDPADVGGNIMYPAMACTFREAGMQLAAHFAYDALCNARFNTNYGTHFMNLAYAPKKALSLKIASAVFHHMPLYTKTVDGKARYLNISYSTDLAEWITNEEFFYSNNTASEPPDASRLKEIAGCGSSSVVKYSGTGAYFLDRISDGVWRLEVMPDAYWIKDPYTPVNPHIQKAAVLHSTQKMTITLPDLGKHFTARPVNEGNAFIPGLSDGSMDLVPGVYLLKRDDVKEAISEDDRYKNIRMGEFVAPASDLDTRVLWNNTSAEVKEGTALTIEFETISPNPVHKITVVVSAGERSKTLPAIHTGSIGYRAEIPSEMVAAGFLEYRIMVEDAENTTTFPGGAQGNPWSWENRDKGTYKISVVPDSARLILWEAGADWESSYKVWNRGVLLKPDVNAETILCITPRWNNQTRRSGQNENKDYAFKFYFAEKIKGRYTELPQKKFLFVKAFNPDAIPQKLEIGLIDRNGTVMAGEIIVSNTGSVFMVPLSTFGNAEFLIIPRPYPEFLAYKVEPTGKLFDWNMLETLQVIVKQNANENIHLNIEKIWLE